VFLMLSDLERRNTAGLKRRMRKTARPWCLRQAGRNPDFDEFSLPRSGVTTVDPNRSQNLLEIGNRDRPMLALATQYEP